MAPYLDVAKPTAGSMGRSFSEFALIQTLPSFYFNILNNKKRHRTAAFVL